MNDANVTRMMYAAEAVHMGVLPYAAMKDNMLKYENSAGANRALQMLANYVQLVKDQRNVDEFMVLLSGEENGNGNGNKYSIVDFQNKQGKKQSYVEASKDRQGVIHGDEPAEWGKQATDYINNTIRKGKDKRIKTDSGVVLTITEDTAGKMAFRNTYDGSGIEYSDEDYALKCRIAVHIDEIAWISQGISSKTPDKKNHPFARDGFTYRRSFYQDYDGSYYTMQLSIGENGKIHTVYNINRIKESQLPEGAQGSAAKYRDAGISDSTGIKAQTSSEVKAKLSLPEPAPADIFADSEIALDESLPNNRKEIGTLMVSMDTERRQLRDEVKRFESEALSEELLNRMTSKDKETVNQALQEYKELEEQAGIAEKQRRAKELDREISRLYKQSDAVRVQELRGRVEKSGLTQAEYFRKAAVKEFGYTPYFVGAGYILPNEKMLNFSGEKGKHFGMRGQDHRAIGTIFEGVVTQDWDVYLNENELVPWLKPSSAAP